MADQIELATVEQVPVEKTFEGSIYNSPTVFEHVQRIAKMFTTSNLVPENYRKNIADCIIAVEMANRLKVHPLMVMQHTAIVHGKPCIEGKFAIALINSRGPYPGGVKFEYKGEGETRKVTAKGTRANGEVDTVDLTVREVKAWGWWDKSGSPWPKMTDQMLAYRSAAFLARRYCPEVIMGLAFRDEVYDVGPVDVTPKSDALNSKIKNATL